MPPEVQETAERADRMVQLGIQLTLLTIVLVLIHGSSISMYAVGLTADNWRSGIALGALVSFIPLGLGEVLSRNLSAAERRKNPESRGPAAMWYELTVVRAFSTELWRAFCITALIRLDLSVWIAILITSVAYAAAQFRVSTARAAGGAVFGGVAGILFIKTGSLLAPLTMSLIAMGAHVYRSRHIPSQNSRVLAPRKCPTCSQAIQRTQIPPGKYFPCPGCGQKLMPYLDWSWQGPVCGIVGAVGTLLVLDLDIFWSAVLFVPLFFLFTLLSAFFVSALPRFRTIKIYRDPGDPNDGSLFRF
ncbi:MAG TPA: CPBP family glutamic-type intramembrane protease [Candidatus Acidoferrales bacterium]|nr:CPBP family glutamic-type intramembrane protease [Candidatus Acidoferrales bacterium]